MFSSSFPHFFVSSGFRKHLTSFISHLFHPFFIHVAHRIVCFHSGTCFSSHRSKNVNGAQNIVGREQHTIRHVQLNPDQIGDKGIPLNIDKVKHTGPKLREEVLRRIGNSVERADNNDKSSFISIKGG